MASWSENSSYQGAASGAVAGSAAGPYGAAVGAVVGFVAGGLIGGSQQDAAKAAENDRLKAIQRAIEMQNTKEFKAKSQAEQFAMADIGINKADQYMDAKANAKDLNNDAVSAYKALNYSDKQIKNDSKNLDATYRKLDVSYAPAGESKQEKINRAKGVQKIVNVTTAIDRRDTNQGIIANYDNEMGAPKKY